MDLPSLSRVLLPKPWSVSSAPSWYPTQHCFSPRDSFYRQWSVIMGSCDEDAIGHSHHWNSSWWEIVSKVSSWILVCPHKFACFCSFQFPLDGSSSFPYIPVYPLFSLFPQPHIMPIFPAWLSALMNSHPRTDMEAIALHGLFNEFPLQDSTKFL